MLALVVFEMSLGHEAASAARVGADVGPLSGVNAKVGLQVSPLTEGLLTAFKRTGEGLLFCLPVVLPAYMRPQVHKESSFPRELLSAIVALDFPSKTTLPSDLPSTCVPGSP